MHSRRKGPCALPTGTARLAEYPGRIGSYSSFSSPLYLPDRLCLISRISSCMVLFVLAPVISMELGSMLKFLPYLSSEIDVTLPVMVTVVFLSTIIGMSYLILHPFGSEKETDAVAFGASIPTFFTFHLHTCEDNEYQEHTLSCILDISGRPYFTPLWALNRPPWQRMP